MDKQILEQYIDACELVEEAKEELRRLKKQRKRIEQDIVKGSSPEFPYTAHNFHVQGMLIFGAQGSQERGGTGKDLTAAH